MSEQSLKFCRADDISCGSFAEFKGRPQYGFEIPLAVLSFSSCFEPGPRLYLVMFRRNGPLAISVARSAHSICWKCSLRFEQRRSLGCIPSQVVTKDSWSDHGTQCALGLTSVPHDVSKELSRRGPPGSTALETSGEQEARVRNCSDILNTTLSRPINKSPAFRSLLTRNTLRLSRKRQSAKGFSTSTKCVCTLFIY